MQLTFIGSEATPFVKTGGLADVLGSLPKAMVKRGHQVALILPKHNKILKNYQDHLKTVLETTIDVGPHVKYCGIQTLMYEGIQVYFVDNEYYYGLRPNLYGDYDDGERYGFFSHAALKIVMEFLPKTDIIHLNDWQTGLISYLLKYDAKYQAISHIKTVFTIHNIAYQGRFSKELMPYLNTDYSNILEFDDVINFLKTGIIASDHITTVSPTYKEELKHAYFAYGLQGILKLRDQSFSGIINGIDTSDFDPEKDDAIDHNYSIESFKKIKPKNKKALLKQFGLKNANLPLIGMVSRITEAKGFSLVADVIKDLVQKNIINFILLGSGDPYFEETFQYFKETYPDNVGVYLGYSDGLAREVYAGSDFFMMPSRFEPCGLSQIIAMRYGTLPIVHKTGGLKDTVEPFNEYTLEGTGFGFDTYDSDDLKQSTLLAINVFNETKTFDLLRKQAMMQNFSWDKSAKDYENLYASLKGDL